MTMSKQLKQIIFTPFAAAILLAGLLLPAGPLAPAAAGQTFEGDFYIITSINKRNHELFLKAPTEVTQLMLVNNKTAFLNQEGKSITFNDLRAGDTVYIVAPKVAPGVEPVAARVRVGPMTAAILHARYLKH